MKPSLLNQDRLNWVKRANFLIAITGVLGSLYFSEVMKLPPCALCWYQRILLYPLALIYLVALWTEDQGYQKYIFPFLAIGLSIASYHNLLYYGFIPEKLAPCNAALSCTSKQLEVFGFITIPLLSLAAFSTLLIGEIVIFIRQKKEICS